jgi:pyruvate-formate lyase-activating enzyme
MIGETPLSPQFMNWRELRSPYPHNLIIDIHSYCNARCQICPYPGLKDQLPMGFMAEDLFKRLIDEFAEVKARHDIRGHVIFCNMGELFMDPEVFWKLAYVKEKGLTNVIQTNAALLTPQKLKKLKECGYEGDVFVSCHGVSKEVYERIMGLPYDKAMANIIHLLENYDRNKISLRTFAHNWPKGEGQKVKEYWARHGMKVRVRIPNARTGLLGKLVGSKLKYPGPWLKGCKKTLPFRDMVITFDGQAILCCEDMARKTNLGDLNTHSLLEVWNSPQAEKIMDHMHGGGWGKKDDFICRTCEFGLSTQFRRLVKNLANQSRIIANRT